MMAKDTKIRAVWIETREGEQCESCSHFEKISGHVGRCAVLRCTVYDNVPFECDSFERRA